MKHAIQTALVGVLVLTVVSLAAAQQSLQPVVRSGDWIEIANETFMNIIAAADIRYHTTHNYDFENKVRDRAASRAPGVANEGENDLSWAELRWGADFRYQKNLTMQILFEHQSVFDGALIDDRSNTTNPGGADIFGNAASGENPGFHIERYWIDYAFPGAKVHLRVGADLWYLDQAGLLGGEDDPRFTVYGTLGAKDEFEWGVSAVVQYEAQRLGLTNDNDFIYYMFHFAYNFKPHKVALDIAYFRDRFNGADTTTTTPLLPRPGLGVLGQKIDSVLIMPSWSGSVGPFRGLLQGNVMVGTATGRVAGVTPGTIVDRDYDILAWGLVAYVDVDLGIVRPFVSLIYGSGDDTSTDTKLGGFTLPESDTAGITGTTWFAIFDTSVAIGSNDTACPARVSNVNLGTGSGCTHTGDIPFNDRLTNRTHPGIVTRFSNPGTLLIPMGVRVFPLKGHEIAGWYLYKAVTDTTNLREALGIPISKTQYHELGGLWLWTLNPHFDIRLAGSVVIPGAGFKDIARLADCQGTPCQGDDVALKAEARFRARF